MRPTKRLRKWVVKNIPNISAICDGRLLIKKFASGYGGVAVESCVVYGQPATVIYGHLKLESIGFKVGDTVLAGSKIGILGKGNTAETDFERKHLHLGIHKGTGVDIRGYVATEAELKDWIDPISTFK